MRILQLTSHLNVGGIASSVLSLASALSGRGHDVVIASGGGQFERVLGERNLAHWPATLNTSVEFGPSVAGAVRELGRRLRAEPVDVLHAHTRVGQVAAARLARRAGVPYVATWHGVYQRNLGRVLWPCTGDMTIAISEPVRQHLIHTFGVPERRIRLIPHGIDPSPFLEPVPEAERMRLREALRLPAGVPVVGTVSRLVAVKGVDRLVRALPGIRARVPDAHALVVGDGPDRVRLGKLAEELGVADAVRFAGTMSETAPALSLMDACVFLPGPEEGFGLVLLEAMASGRPIVALRGGGASWVLSESPVGLVFDADDLAGMTAGVIRLLRSPAEARALGQGAQAIVTDRYSLTRMAEHVEGVYRELVESGARA
ncbi:MAG TPA: glycosyltransferase family 4 protein [bacterium]